jgi:hypothetical protein
MTPGIQKDHELADNVDVCDGEVGFEGGEIAGYLASVSAGKHPDDWRRPGDWRRTFFSARSVPPDIAALATLKPICAVIGSVKNPPPPCAKLPNCA